MSFRHIVSERQNRVQLVGQIIAHQCNPVFRRLQIVDGNIAVKVNGIGTVGVCLGAMEINSELIGFYPAVWIIGGQGSLSGLLELNG